MEAEVERELLARTLPFFVEPSAISCVRGRSDGRMMRKDIMIIQIIRPYSSML